ncbi:hypothetical protein DVH24_042454 [Malus domestica]|uniref:Protein DETOXIFICATION n=1 Tax=Malus domestica TaxID=3750 RepID=A0A498J3F1_MALDO|nr:hypothetical protein DVH24_042454 [Malus domestica]
MQTKTPIAHPPHSPLLQNPTPNALSQPSLSFTTPSLSFPPRFHHTPTLRLPWLRSSAPLRRRNRFSTASNAETPGVRSSDDGGDDDASVSAEEVVEVKKEVLESQNLWNRMKEIAVFTGPATGLWLCGPLMSLIDTVIIGQGSSIELAALGPGTVMCDYMSYVFMFLSIATSNMVATALARRDKSEVQHQISILLFDGLASGFLMLSFTRFFGSWALTAFTGSKNADIIHAANTYVQIRGLAWPALLVGWVAQSASLGMKDSWGPLKALAVASAVNGVGDVLLCSFLGYGIAGAAWATMVSQVVAGYMMTEALNKKGYNAYVISVPSSKELLTVLGLAAPVLIKMISKVAFYSLLVCFATSMGTNTMVAHQYEGLLEHVFHGCFPISLHLIRRSFRRYYFIALSPIMVTSFSLVSIFCFFQAGRDLRYISLSMSGCFSLGALLLLLVSSRGVDLAGCWWALAAFQWSRFFPSLQRLISPNGLLYSEDMTASSWENIKLFSPGIKRI